MSVTPAGANQMMRGQKTDGSAESGCGVSLSGFYCPNTEVPVRLGTLDKDQGPFSEVALHESEGWTTVIAASRQNDAFKPGRAKIASLRRESHKFFEDIGPWLFRTRAVDVHRISVSQSGGFISLVLLYSDGV